MASTQDNKTIMYQESIIAWYSHTSRIWNGAVSSTLAIISLFIASMSLIRTQFLQAILEYWLYVFAIFLLFYLASFYLIVRIGEIGVQIQFLERRMKVNKETSLLSYVNDNLPRLGWLHKRLSDDEIEKFSEEKKPYTLFLRQCANILLLWTVAYVIYAVLFFFLR